MIFLGCPASLQGELRQLHLGQRQAAGLTNQGQSSFDVNIACRKCAGKLQALKVLNGR